MCNQCFNTFLSIFLQSGHCAEFWSQCFTSADNVMNVIYLNEKRVEPSIWCYAVTIEAPFVKSKPPIQMSATVTNQWSFFSVSKKSYTIGLTIFFPNPENQQFDAVFDVICLALSPTATCGQSLA